MTNLTNFNAWTGNNTHILGEFIRAYRVSFLLYDLYHSFCTLIIVYRDYVRDIRYCRFRIEDPKLMWRGVNHPIGLQCHSCCDMDQSYLLSFTRNSRIAIHVHGSRKCLSMLFNYREIHLIRKFWFWRNICIEHNELHVE